MDSLNKRILVGDVLEKLREIPDESIDCVVTSPPYWRLRDYEVKGQMGNEETFQEYLGKLDSMMVELKRIVKSTGSVWINLGDSYNSEKSLNCIPDEFKINCRNAGWKVRNHVIWQKPNAMPSSVKDRLSSKYESIFFFVKSKKYYYDLEAIRIPMKTVLSSGGEVKENYLDLKKKFLKQDNVKKADGTIDQTKKGFNDRWRKHKEGSNYGNAEQKIQEQRDAGKHHDLGLSKLDGKKNPGDVWEINTKPFPEAHFATFPPELPRRIIKCACPKDGIVLDPFMGSGTTAMVAEELGRKWIGIELNGEYVNIIKKRLENKK